ncbi:MarR family winged helix-turn-helix transcriptional regulator [Actinophytocola oryzae]|uniref:MarR family transcriptional regulator n=1 Tax=Actinophytocola oryzae TaxID=502181 RepID=A0A4R7VY83_9PSEU|nr:MarR family transcriptional regulator [Actinophytocola oryzae]TDV55130.1 MarR family transcriptional regulator [Actinophytocola oryzae]
MTMKYVHDQDGLYDPSVREAVGRFADTTETFEAASAVRTAAHAVERLQNLGERNRALSPGAVDLLLRLDGGDAHVGELARDAGFSSRNVTGLVDTLEQKGLVRRTPDPADRRAVRVSATDGGHAWVAEFREPARRAMAALFHGFTDAEVASLRDLCLRLVVNQEAVSRRMTPKSTMD